jgi:hypothetical protein
MIVEFMDNDKGYVAWLSEHPDGFVLNCGRPPTPSYLVLHRATCWSISGMVERGGSVRAYVVPHKLHGAVKKHILADVEEGSELYTDDSRIYDHMEQAGWYHEKVQHSQEVFVSGPAHTFQLSFAEPGKDGFIADVPNLFKMLNGAWVAARQLEKYGRLPHWGLPGPTDEPGLPWLVPLQ